MYLVIQKTAIDFAVFYSCHLILFFVSSTEDI